jgi:hypothetical protein
MVVRYSEKPGVSNTNSGVTATGNADDERSEVRAGQRALDMRGEAPFSRDNQRGRFLK